jgi:hypothetical protein
MRCTTGTLTITVFLVISVQPINALQQRGREAGIVRAVSSPAINTNIENIARDLSDKAQDAWNAVYNQRATSGVELYVTLAGFASSTKAYWEMAADAREDSSLRNAAGKIVAAATEIDSLVGNIQIQGLAEAWRLVQPKVAELSNTYSLGYTYRGRLGTRDIRRGRGTVSSPTATSRFFRWRGRVDGSDYILLQGSQVTIRHLEYQPITGASYELPTPLPQAVVQVRLNKIKGRGQVELVRQPTAENNYTVAVMIEDPLGGDDLYEFELTW